VAEIGWIELNEESEYPLVRMRGEFDLSNAEQLHERLTELADRGWDKVIVDLSATTFIDSTALAAFALAYRRGLHLVLRHPDTLVRRELDTSGLTALFDIEGA